MKYKNKLRPDVLTKSDSRIFIKDFVSATDLVLRCHQNAGKYNIFYEEISLIFPGQ